MTTLGSAEGLARRRSRAGSLLRSDAVQRQRSVEHLEKQRSAGTLDDAEEVQRRRSTRHVASMVPDNDRVADLQQVALWVQRLENQACELERASAYANRVKQCPPTQGGTRLEKFIRDMHHKNKEEATGQNQTLGDKYVIVVGTGPTGSFVAEELARAGICKLGFLDRGIVSAEHVANSCFTFKHVGMSKAWCMKRIVQDLSQDIVADAIQADIEQEPTVLDKFLDSCSPDLVISCLCGLRSRFVLSTWCLEKQLPLVELAVEESHLGGRFRAKLGKVPVHLDSHHLSGELGKCQYGTRGEPAETSRDSLDSAA